MVFQFVISNLSATTAKNCAVNKHQLSYKPLNIMSRFVYRANCDYFLLMRLFCLSELCKTIIPKPFDAERNPDLNSVVLPALKYLLKHEFLLHTRCFLSLRTPL